MPRLDEKALLVKLSISQWTARKEDKKVTKEVEDNHHAANAGRYHKHLLAKTALEKIQKNVNEACTYHYTHTLPWSIDGQDILPTKIYFEYTQAIGKFKATHESNVTDFLFNYPQYIEEAKKRLNGLFKQEDYPPVDKLKKLFSFSIQFYPLPAASDFRVELGKDEIDRIKTDLERQLKNTEQQAIKDLWERLYKTVSHAAERLGDSKAVFRNTLIENIQELVNLLPKLNFTDNPDLEKMRREVESKLLKFSPEILRDDKQAREQTAKEAKNLLSGIKPYLDNGEEKTPETSPTAAPPETTPPGWSKVEASPEGKPKTTAPEEAKAKLAAMQTLF